MAHNGRDIPTGWQRLAPCLALGGIAALVFAVYMIVVGPPWVPPMQKWLPNPIQIRRPDLNRPATPAPLRESLKLEERRQILREGYGVRAVCIVAANGRDRVLQSTVVMEPDLKRDPDERRRVFEKRTEAFKEIVARCNAVGIEHTIVFIDRTRPGMNDAISEQVRRRLGEPGVYDAFQRGNGLEVSLHLMSASVFHREERKVAFPPPPLDEDAGQSCDAARRAVEKAVDELLAKPTGERTSALARTLSDVLMEARPGPGTKVRILSDYLEQDPSTAEVDRPRDRPPRRLVDDPKRRARLEDVLRKALVLPPLTGVAVDCYLLPVPSELERMIEMAELFGKQFAEHGAAVTIHKGR